MISTNSNGGSRLTLHIMFNFGVFLQIEQIRCSLARCIVFNTHAKKRDGLSKINVCSLMTQTLQSN